MTEEKTNKTATNGMMPDMETIGKAVKTAGGLATAIGVPATIIIPIIMLAAILIPVILAPVALFLNVALIAYAISVALRRTGRMSNLFGNGAKRPDVEERRAAATGTTSR